MFDGPFVRTPVVLSAATTTRRCRLIEGDDHQVINPDTQKPFTFGDACVEKGPTVAYNETVSTQARVFVREFLTKMFNLNP